MAVCWLPGQVTALTSCLAAADNTPESVFALPGYQSEDSFAQSPSFFPTIRSRCSLHWGKSMGTAGRSLQHPKTGSCGTECLVLSLKHTCCGCLAPKYQHWFLCHILDFNTSFSPHLLKSDGLLKASSYLILQWKWLKVTFLEWRLAAWIVLFLAGYSLMCLYFVETEHQ